MAAAALVLGIAIIATYHYGPDIGWLAGAIQATTVWTIMRGRLAEADVLLACLITWTIVAFDCLITKSATKADGQFGNSSAQRSLARWTFFALLGIMGLVKGIGFGAILTLAVVVGMLFWHRDRTALRQLFFLPGWTLAALLTLAWPLWMVRQHGSGVLTLWVMHVANRFGNQTGLSPFASEPWWEYIPALLTQGLPWTPLTFAGAWHSLGRVVQRANGCSSSDRVNSRIPVGIVTGDRLLWVWAVMPLALLAMATVKNAHYAISAQGPWSIWAALAFARLGKRSLRTYDRGAFFRTAQVAFTALALTCGLAIWVLGPWFDRRGVEWAFYESVGRRFPPNLPLLLLYDDWDRRPYESPFGPIPHDLAVRLFYLGRPACWHFGPESVLAQAQPAGRHSASIALPIDQLCSPAKLRSAFAVLSRAHNLSVLRQIGNVQVVAHGPRLRRDRTYDLFLITPKPVMVDLPIPIANSENPIARR
jgi:4-amino-4-deoxy-L-arabinose transferase-like glycosyltransferase